MLGAMASNGPDEWPVACNATRTLDEKPGCEFITLMIASLDKGPTYRGLHETLKVNVCPEVRANGVRGRFDNMKLASPLSPIPSTLVLVTALQVTANELDTLLSETEPKS